MADLTLTTNLQQCGGNEYSNTLYTAVYMNIVSQNASTGVTTLHIQIAGWAANNAGGGSTRHWSGVFRMYKGTSGDVALIDGSFGPADYANYTSPVWVINQNYTIQHTRSGGTWQAIQSYGVNVVWVTQKNGTVTHGHRWTTQGYNNCVIPAFNVTSYTVKYNGNGNNGGTVPGNQTKYHNVALTLATNNLTHANSGATANGYKVSFNANGGSSTPAAITQTTYTIYTKNGWNTNSAGTGTHYNNGASYTGNAALTLYAQWSTSTGRNAITLPAAISRTGYTFGGWNTNSSGTGSNYAAGSSYTPSAAITLYAKWTINSYNLTCNPNGGTSTATSGWTASGSNLYKAHNYNANYTFPSNPTRSGYRFLGWYTAASGGSQVTTSTKMGAGATTVYAHWIQLFYLDVNGLLDGAYAGNTSGYGTFDVTVGGTSRANDVADHYAQYDKGSSYSISDIKATTGHVYLGVAAGAASGTINAATSVQLSFYSQTVWIYHNGWHRAIPWVYYNGAWHRALARVYNGGWKNCKT